MKSYVLNIWNNKVEVYETRYVPKSFCEDGREKFYSNSTLFVYLGGLPLEGRVYNTAHRQVEDCKNGNLSHTQYFGGRNNSHPFKYLTRAEVIQLFK